MAFYDGGARDAVPRLAELEWPDLVTLLTTHRASSGCSATPCTDRKCPAKLSFPAWSPVALKAPRRLNENVEAVTAAVFDLDHLTEQQVDVLEFGSLAWLLYSTHSSKPGDICLRLVMPLNRPVKPDEWAAVRSAAITRHAIPADPAVKDLARLYFLPDAPAGTEPLAAACEGKPLDVDDLLASARTLPAAQITPTPAAPIDLSQVPVDVQELAKRLRAYVGPANRALVGWVLRGEPLSPRSSGPYGGQDAALQALMSTTAFCLPDTTPDDAILHLFRASFAATDWEEGTEHLCQEALKKLQRARQRKAKFDADRLAKNAEVRAKLGIRDTSEATPMDEDAPEDPDAWLNELLWNERRDKTGKVVGQDLRNCEANVELVLRRAAEWRNVLRFNRVTKKLECTNPPPGMGSSDAEGLDIDLAIWFQRSQYGSLGLRPKPNTVQDVIRQVIRVSGYNPLREYLDGLVWDRTPRVDSFLETYFGAGEDAPEYIRAVSRRWLISFVSRGLTPGTKVDTVLVLEGEQGLKKSTAVEALSAPWFCDSKIDITNKDTWMLAAQFWMIELAELEAMSARTKETLKAFFARRSDTYREPYGRVNATTPRQCVFVATTNSEEYLQVDPSGYRRFWPIACSKIDVAALKRDRDQILAEAVTLQRAGEQHWLTDDEAKLAKEATARRVSAGSEAFSQKLIEWLARMAPEKRPLTVTMLKVLTDAIGLEAQQVTKAREMETAAVLHSLGFKHRTQAFGGARSRVWEVPAALLEQPQMIGAPTASSPAQRLGT